MKRCESKGILVGWDRFQHSVDTQEILKQGQGDEDCMDEELAVTVLEPELEYPENTGRLGMVGHLYI